MRRRTLAILISFVFSLSTLVLGAIVFALWFTNPGPLKQPIDIWIAPGQSFSKINQQLKQHGILTYSWLFEFHVRLRGASKKLHAGEYHFPAYITPERVLKIITSGKTIQYSFTVPEGTTTFRVLQQLQENPFLTGSLTFSTAEGELLPETYSYTRNENRNEILNRLRQAMSKKLDKLWSERDSDLPLGTPQQALILASIVEKETKVAAERPRIAAVFLNRLKKGMRLQADPTVLYGLNLSKDQPIQELRRKDLQTSTPYNTYIHKGLPPTPICNPGKASLKAVLHPMTTDDLFFVADGSGGHVFSESYRVHKKHHNSWRKNQRALRLHGRQRTTEAE